MTSGPRDLTTTLTSFFHTNRPPGLVSAYLFGSRVRGDAHRESDVDVAVLLDARVVSTVRQRFDTRVDLIGALSRALATDAVDLVVLNDAPPHLARRIMIEGARVFCADAEADHAARRTALLRAADLEPFLRRTRAAKLRAIAR